MTKPNEYTNAKGRAEAKYGFLTHAGVFVAVMALLILIDLLTTPGEYWFVWPLLGWGFAVALHGARVFLFPGRSEAIEAMTERELRRSPERKGGTSWS
jgi:hypothetical protein